MRYLSLCPILLMGCGVQPIVSTPQEVFLPGVQIPCVPKPVEVPQWATDVVPLEASYLDKIKAMGEEVLQHAAYETDLAAALQSCTGLKMDPTLSSVAPAPVVVAPAVKPTLVERFKGLFKRN